MPRTKSPPIRLSAADRQMLTGLVRIRRPEEGARADARDGFTCLGGHVAIRSCRFCQAAAVDATAEQQAESVHRMVSDSPPTGSAGELVS
jgi:hypothetical protein